MARLFPQKAIAVFAKPPLPGRVKTRLLAALAPQEAAEVHLACMRDTLRMIGSIGGARKWLLVAGSAGSAQKLARAIPLNRRWRVGLQAGRDLGARLEFAFASLLENRVRKVVIVGTDTPWMGAQRILRALELLDRADVVLGPTDDGGYYLVGARRVVPEMFRGIDWGTERVLAQTLAALRRAGVRHRLLRRDFDLDRPRDLRRVERLLRRKRIRAAALKQWLLVWGLKPRKRRGR